VYLGGHSGGLYDMGMDRGQGMNWTLEVILCGLLVSAVMLTVSLVLYSLEYLAISNRKG
jgi:hypothetical protein